MTTLEFDGSEFLECFDTAFLSSVHSRCEKIDRDVLYNRLQNEIEKFVLSIEVYGGVSQKIEINEIEFLLSVFEIIDSIDIKGFLNLQEFLEHMKNFSKRYRNITKTLDNLNTKLTKQDMKIDKIMETSNYNLNFPEALFDFSIIYTIVRFVIYIISNIPNHKEDKQEEFFSCYDNETFVHNLD